MPLSGLSGKSHAIFRKCRATLFPAAALSAVAVSALVSWRSLGRNSLTFDEVIYPAAGYDFLLTGKVRFNPEHPPLAKAASALGLLPLSPRPPGVDPSDGRGFAAGEGFFSGNSSSAPDLAAAARRMSVAAFAALSLVFFLGARRRFEDPPALTGLLFLLCDPALRAFASLATGDIFAAAFLTAAILALDASLLDRKRERSLLLCSGLLGGAAFLSKFTGLLFLPSAFLIIGSRKGWREASIKTAALAAAAAALSLLMYRGEWPRLLEGLRFQAANAREGFHAAYFLGRLREGAIPFFYPAALLIKTPWPFLLASSFGVWAMARARDKETAGLILIPAALFFLSASLGRLYALRYLLPVFPLMALSVCAAARRASSGSRGLRALILLLALWQAGEAAAAHPYPLSYMNRPWRSLGHRVLSGSDFDWGQGLPALRDFWEREGRPALSLCYLGTAEPEDWGLQAQELAVPGASLPGTRVLPLSPPKEYLALSAGCLQFMTLKTPEGLAVPAWDWLKSRRPLAVPGGVFLVYDVTRDAQAHGRLGQLHFFQGEHAKALREARRVLEIDPADLDGRRFLEAVRSKMPAVSLSGKRVKSHAI